jgi:(E)-4-hydroxy-3-methylbut-2-enyl-diphosphate synthase
MAIRELLQQAFHINFKSQKNLYKSGKIIIGNLEMGGDAPVRVQSMTNTNTLDTEKSISQIIKLVDAGCDLVRLTTQNIAEAENIKTIKSELVKKGIDIPIIADVHFNPKIAEVAAKYADKVRINPGNYYSNPDALTNYDAINKNLVPLLEICKANNTAIRIGVNHGSLSKRILEQYGDTPLGMVESLMEFVEICNDNEFHNLVISVKTSDVRFMIEANELLVKRLEDNNHSYPIHLGVTEAGGDDEGRIKSAAGIGYLLCKGIGDTVRVSLSEDPVNEVPVAKYLVDSYSINNNLTKPEEIFINVPSELVKTPLLVSDKPSSHSDLCLEDVFEEGEKIKLAIFEYPPVNYYMIMLNAAVDITHYILNNRVEALTLFNGRVSADNNMLILKEVLQALGLRIFRTEYIACPTCGRTNIDLLRIFQKTKFVTSHLKGLKIAVMGCIVNGPGEMRGADYGIVGVGKGYVNLYKKGEIIERKIDQYEATEALVKLMKESGDWKDK